MAILFRRSNGIYYHVTSINGHRVWRSTGKRRRIDAERYLRELTILEEHQETMVPSAQAIKAVSPTFLAFVSQWRTYAETNFAPSTIRLYNEAIRNFTRIIGDKPLAEYRALHMEQFKAQRLKDVSPSKTNIDYRNVKAILNVAVKWEMLSKNPCTGVKLVKIPPERPTYLTKAEFSLLHESIKIPWLKDVVAFAVSTMMRAGEIVNLTWESVDLGKRIILVENKNGFRLKTTQPRYIPMNDWVAGYLSQRTAREGYVFTFPDGRRLSVDRLSHKFKHACRAAGLSNKVHLHSLRHTGASWLVQDGASIYAVQKILGHSNIEVTMRYSHLVPNELYCVVNKIRV
jgi:integrase